MNCRQTQAGLTLVELVVSIVILAVALTGILMVITQTTRHNADPMVREQAIAIARSYLTEIMLQPLADPGGGNGEGERRLFDDVWDYAGLSDDTGARDQNGNNITGLEGYNVGVHVENSGVTLGGSPATRIQVTVTHDGHAGVNVPISAYRLN